ncbi:MAG TPA: serine protease [Pyrinomonadaceae bacterium]|nr:serine protease [Pyrinomonadaceae bacterium]
MPDDTNSRDPKWFLQRMPSTSVLDEVLQGDPVTRLLGIAKDRAIANETVVVEPRANADTQAVAAALKLAVETAKRITVEGESLTLTAKEKAALQLFILLVARPAIFVQNGKIAERPANWPEVARDEELLPRIIAGVGRIDTAAHEKCGTGFIVGQRRIVTNNHVLCALLGRGSGFWEDHPGEFSQLCDQASESWSTKPAKAPRFELHGELNSTASTEVRLKRVLGHHRNVDMALLELSAEPSGSRRLPLMGTEPASFIGRRIYVVGYPVDDSRDTSGERTTPALVFNRIFGTDDSTLGTKRFSPGVVLGWDSRNTFNHDASTLPGSSGSCIVDFEHRRVVGLHFAGHYRLKSNFAIPLWKFKDDPVLAGNGVTFD